MHGCNSYITEGVYAMTDDQLRAAVDEIINEAGFQAMVSLESPTFAGLIRSDRSPFPDHEGKTTRGGRDEHVRRVRGSKRGRFLDVEQAVGDDARCHISPISLCLIDVGTLMPNPRNSVFSTHRCLYCFLQHPRMVRLAHAHESSFMTR